MKSQSLYPARSTTIRAFAILLLLCELLVSTGCTYEEQHRGAFGAIGGAAAGGILGGRRGAAAGAIIGGLLGAGTARGSGYYNRGYYPRSVPSSAFRYY